VSRRPVTVLMPDGSLLCQCTRIYATTGEARKCTGSHEPPIIPGDDMGAHRAGQTYVRSSTYSSAAAAAPRGAHPMLLVLLGALVVIVAALGFLLAMRELGAGGGGTSWQIPDSGYPTTYGPPGPTGGPVLEVAGQ
jgi:hypothetical protein